MPCACRIELPELLVIDSDILRDSAVNLLQALRGKGYAGPVIALEDEAAPVARGDLAEDPSLQVLHKPLAMRQLFQAVELALALAKPG